MSLILYDHYMNSNLLPAECPIVSLISRLKYVPWKLKMVVLWDGQTAVELYSWTATLYSHPSADKYRNGRKSRRRILETGGIIVLAIFGNCIKGSEEQPEGRKIIYFTNKPKISHAFVSLLSQEPAKSRALTRSQFSYNKTTGTDAVKVNVSKFI